MPKVRFVWQYDGPSIDGLPKNVFTQPWLPQQDLLGHPKCRVHISHGGMNSVIESVWHGVPTIGVPLTFIGGAMFGVPNMVPHARSGADKLNVFQYFLVDVIAFMISVVILLITTVYLIIRTAFRFIKYIVLLPFRRTPSSKTSQKRMNNKKTN
ncbi:hypothetical protein OSTOST_03085 [Ostertagia ostertagi]